MEAQVIRLSLDTILIAFIPVVIAMFGGSWVLLNSLVSKPIIAVKNELHETNQGLKQLSDTVSDSRADIKVINEWRGQADRRFERLEEVTTQ